MLDCQEAEKKPQWDNGISIPGETNTILGE
jgi:hypothetical protein